MRPQIRYAAGVEASGDRTLRGTFVRYGDRARIGDYEEEFVAGAFRPIPDSVPVNAMHQRHVLLARSGAGLEIEDDHDALRGVVTLAKTRAADDALEAVEAGLLTGWSIEFYPVESRTSNGVVTRTRARLAGVGLVDSPAYPESKITRRIDLSAPNGIVRWLYSGL